MVPNKTANKKNSLIGIFFLALVPLVAHVSFSWIGFLFADDGFMLAMSRRLLEGQVPHRDFINKTGIISPLLHLPEVWLGGEYTYWISRYVVWLEFAGIAWMWLAIIQDMFQVTCIDSEKFLMALIAFCFAAHTHPPWAWYTIDGVFLITLGIYLARQSGNGSKFCGYFFIGMAYLSKQNFAAALPGVLLVLHDWRRLRYWLAGALPTLLYLFFLFCVSGLEDAVFQLTAYTYGWRIWNYGIYKYLTAPAFLVGTAIGFFAIECFARVGRKGSAKGKKFYLLLGSFFLFIIPFVQALALMAGRYPSFGIFGVVLGVTLGLAIRFSQQDRHFKGGFLVLITAWCASISYGYRTPALGAAGLVLFLLLVGHEKLSTFRMKRLFTWLILALSAATLVGFTVARREHVYLDMTAERITQPLDGVFPGAKNIRVNPNAYALAIDLQQAIAMTNGKTYCIIPDFPGYWTKASQVNPLSIDWPNWQDIAHPLLLKKMQDEIVAARGGLIVIVQKIDVSRTDLGLFPRVTDAELVDYVTSRYELIGKTKYFDVYQ